MSSRSVPDGLQRDTSDDARLRHARERNTGFAVGRYLQAPPMLFTRDGHNLFFGDMYRGNTAFLICGGPSLKDQDLGLLDSRGILTCGVNNSAATYRPNLWVSVDDPSHFCDAIWQDPGILKFVPLCHMEKHFLVRDEQNELVSSSGLVGDMPAVFGYRRNEAFQAEQWLHEDTFNWGNHSKRYDDYGNKGSRSVMYVALRLMYYLGVRRVYLLGCDFRMNRHGQNYAFEQARTASSVRSNNSSYRILNIRLSKLKPYFDQEGFEVFNCTPDSGLQVFPYVPFEEAVETARSIIPCEITTSGMYDRSQRERDLAKQRKEVKHNGQPETEPDAHSEEVKKVLAQLTLMTAVDRQSIETLRHTWLTWMRFRPELRDVPILIAHEPGIDFQAEGLDFLSTLPNVTLIPWEPEPQVQGRDRWSKAYLELAAQHVSTAWYLKLEPEAIACRPGPWIFPDWFAPDVEGKSAVFITSPWTYTKPADAIEQLDQWADQVEGLREHDRLDLPFNPSASRMRHETVSTWCFWGNTQWTKEVLSYAQAGLPCASFDTFVYYCASRRRDPFLRVPMKDLGWTHSFQGRMRIPQRCQKLLAGSRFRPSKKSLR